MVIYIIYNVSSLTVSSYLNRASSKLNTNYQRLNSGSKISSSKDTDNKRSPKNFLKILLNFSKKMPILYIKILTNLEVKLWFQQLPILQF